MEVGVASLVVDVAAAVGLFAKRRPLLTGADFETVSTNLEKMKDLLNFSFNESTDFNSKQIAFLEIEIGRLFSVTIDLLAGVMTALKWPNAKKLLLTREMIIAQCQKFHANEPLENGSALGKVPEVRE